MTVAQLHHVVMAILKDGECDSPSFDAICLLEDVGKIGRGRVPQSYNQEVSGPSCEQVIAAAKERAQGVPLQYILGSWDFLGLTLAVGEGVLIPRPETELLCEIVAREVLSLTTDAPIEIWDLCAGTGCVGLGIASLLPDEVPFHVTEFELSSDAFVYLEQNLRRYKKLPVTAVCADVLNDFDQFIGTPTIIVSNPPYIPQTDLDALQREVQHEPRMALDGGDGFRFYHCFAENWIPKLASNGMIAVEVGIHQAASVANMFEAAGLKEVRSVTDYAGIERIVVGRK